jgi:hypothetical protein
MRPEGKTWPFEILMKKKKVISLVEFLIVRENMSVLKVDYKGGFHYLEKNK